MKKLQEEVHLLSRSKRWLEQQLLKVKSHLWTLDNMRKTMKTKISILSQTLELNAQNMKVSGKVHNDIVNLLISSQSVHNNVDNYFFKKLIIVPL